MPHARLKAAALRVEYVHLHEQHGLLHAADAGAYLVVVIIMSLLIVVFCQCLGLKVPSGPQPRFMAGRVYAYCRYFIRGFKVILVYVVS